VKAFSSSTRGLESSLVVRRAGQPVDDAADEPEQERVHHRRQRPDAIRTPSTDVLTVDAFTPTVAAGKYPAPTARLNAGLR
jgi:hypothetical protein